MEMGQLAEGELGSKVQIILRKSAGAEKQWAAGNRRR